MSFLKVAATFLILGFSLLANGTMVTLDFESLKQPDANFTFLSGSYAEKGFTLTASNIDPFSFASAGDLNARYAGSTAITTFNYGVVSLFNTSGKDFDFLSVDLAPVSLGANDPFGSNRDVNSVYETTIFGQKADGTIVSQLIILPNQSVSNILTTFQLNGFTGLSQVAILNESFPGVQFDNLVLNSAGVSAVPLPGAIWLFSTGLLCFMGYRKRA